MMVEPANAVNEGKERGMERRKEVILLSPV